MSQPLSQKNGYKQGMDRDEAEYKKRRMDPVRRWGKQAPKKGETAPFVEGSEAMPEDEVAGESTPMRDLVTLILLVIGLAATVTGATMVFGVGVGFIVFGVLVLALGVFLGVA